MNREDLDACTNRPDCPAREHVMACPSDRRRAESEGIDADAHMTETDPGLLTPDEHRAVAMAGDLWGLLCKITTTGLARQGDLAELIAHIHGIQRAVLKQAAARAYPELYRVLGGDPPPLPAGEWPDAETHTEHRPAPGWVPPSDIPSLLADHGDDS